MHIVVGELNAYQTMIEDCNQLASKNLLNPSATKTARRIIMIMHLKGWYLKTSSIRQRVGKGIHWDEYQGEEEVGVRLERKNIRYNN